jgi:hypothetical protein
MGVVENILGKDKLSLDKVNEILNNIQYGHHYLRYKSIKEWDEYDWSNWNSILRTVRVN